MPSNDVFLRGTQYHLDMNVVTLHEKYRHQNDKNMKLGWALETLYEIACEIFERLNPRFHGTWLGWDAYLIGGRKGQPSDMPDFALYWDGKVFCTVECKNTRGTYYVSQHVKKGKVKADHYIFGKVKSGDATVKHLRKYDATSTTLGCQVRTWPIRNGAIKAVYAGPLLRLIAWTGVLLERELAARRDFAYRVKLPP